MPTRRPKTRKTGNKGFGVKGGKVDGIEGAVRESLSKHAERRAEAAARMEDNSDIDIIAVGEEEVEKVKELGIDRARKAGGKDGSKSKSSFSEMLKTGLNTLNTIQTMSRVLGGSDPGGSGGGKSLTTGVANSSYIRKSKSRKKCRFACYRW